MLKVRNNPKCMIDHLGYMYLLCFMLLIDHLHVQGIKYGSYIQKEFLALICLVYVIYMYCMNEPVHVDISKDFERWKHLQQQSPRLVILTL